MATKKKHTHTSTCVQKTSKKISEIIKTKKTNFQRVLWYASGHVFVDFTGNK